MTEENTTVVPTTESQEHSAESVPLDQATDDQLDAFLASTQVETQVETDSSGQTEDVQASEEGQSATVSQEQEQQENDAVAAEKREATPEIESLTKENERKEALLRKKTEALRKLEREYQRRSSEFGEMRSRLVALQGQLAKPNEESLLDDPDTVIDRKLQLRETQRELERVAAEESAYTNRVRSMEQVVHFVGPDDFDVEAIGQTLARDGFSQEQIAAFKSDPFSKADGVTLINLAKRAKAESLIAGVVKYAQNLEKEIAELKKKPGQLLSSIDKAAKAKPITAAAGGAGQERRSPTTATLPKSLDKLSDAELDELLRQQ